MYRPRLALGKSRALSAIGIRLTSRLPPSVEASLSDEGILQAHLGVCLSRSGVSEVG